MTMLYELRLSGRNVGTVKATPDFLGISGHLNTETGEICRPDMAAVRECLPHYYRKAFDREGAFWYPSTGDTNLLASMTLRSSRGHTMATLYASPYYYIGGK